MPNWAWGSVSVTGTKQNVLKFSGRFIYEGEEDVKNETGIPYFARSFAQKTRSEATDEINTIFNDMQAEAESTFTLYVDFAWSANSCLIKGAPQQFPTECITLMDACIADAVSAEIKTEEPGNGFEETIYCSKDGNYDSHSRKMQTCICPSCGAFTLIPSSGNADEYECHDCGKAGLKSEEES